MIETYTGIMFDFLNPTQESIRIEDIAHALSNLCRFTGHGLFYSVAQHSLACSAMAVAPRAAYAALMHDAHEAYTGDISTPLKALLPYYRKIANHIQKAINEKYNVPGGGAVKAEVKYIDRMMLVTEKKEILGNSNMEHWPSYDGYPPNCMCYSYAAIDTEAMFLDLFRSLHEKVGTQG